MHAHICMQHACRHTSISVRTRLWSGFARVSGMRQYKRQIASMLSPSTMKDNIICKQILCVYHLTAYMHAASCQYIYAMALDLYNKTCMHVYMHACKLYTWKVNM